MSERPLQSGSKFFASLISSFGAAPFGGQLVADAASVLDGDTARDAKTPTERIQAKVPFWRESLPERKDALGKPLEKSPYLGLVDPFSTKKRRGVDDEVVAVLEKYQVPITKPTQDIKNGETDDQYRERAQAVADEKYRLVKKLIESEAFQKLASSPDANTRIPEVIGDYMKKASARMTKLYKRKRASAGLADIRMEEVAP